MKKLLKSKVFKFILFICFIVYIAILLKAIIFKPPYSFAMVDQIIKEWDISKVNFKAGNIIPFATITSYYNAYRTHSLSNVIIFDNLILNIIAFIPLGTLQPLIFKKIKSFKSVMTKSLIFILSIELFQYIAGVGSFDIDDIILNGTGVILGYIIYKGIIKLK